MVSPSDLSPESDGSSVQIKFQWRIGADAAWSDDYGKTYTNFEFKAMMNGGYIVKATLYDSNFNINDRLIEDGYFDKARVKHVELRFKISYSAESQQPVSATKEQYAILISLRAYGRDSDNGYLEFIGIDPASYFLNIGDAAGSVYNGSIDQVIRQVVQRYAPRINLTVSKTTDSQQNKWWMMRQDPKTFISSLIDWSPSITQDKTHWILGSDGFDLAVKEQSKWISKQRGFYKVLYAQEKSNIINWELLADNALSAVEERLLTQGSAAISGHYIDRFTSPKAIVEDDTTTNKVIAKTTADQSFTKASGRYSDGGYSSITSIPEVYSAGELGLKYDDYIDGRPRAMYLNLLNALMRVKFEIVGHGEWFDGFGLGVDTVFVKWTQAKKPNGDDGDRLWWLSGSWIVYGFHHRVSRRKWLTDLYCARYDHNAIATKVPSI